jgi:FHA domain
MLQVRPTAPGGWLVVATANCVLAVDSDAGSTPSANDLLAALATDAGVQSALELLTSRGLSKTPGFALVSTSKDGALRCIVRGSARVSIARPEGALELSAEAVDTWLEQSFPAGEFRILLGETGSSTDPALLPLVSGAVWADLVISGEASATVAAAASKKSTTAKKAAPSTPRVSDAGVADATISDVTAIPPADSTESTPPPVPAPPTPASGYDHLFGETVVRSVEEAAVRISEPTDAESDAAPPRPLIDVPGFITGSQPQREVTAVNEVSGDHDGLTVFSGDLHELRRERSRERPPARTVAPGPVFRLELVDGSTEPLDRTLLVGRAPSVSKTSGDDVPRLLTVTSVEQDISRNHVRFTIEGGTVVITDLHSRNGTTIVLPGKPPQKLRAGEPTSVIADTVVDLGGDVRLTVRQSLAAEVS